MEFEKLKHKANGKDYTIRGIMISTAGTALITEDSEGKEYVEALSVFEDPSNTKPEDLSGALTKVGVAILGKDVLVNGTKVKGHTVAYTARVNLGESVLVQYVDRNLVVHQQWFDTGLVSLVEAPKSKPKSKSKTKK